MANGCANGKGTIKFVTGDSFNGEFKNGKYYSGTYFYANGDSI